MFCYGFVELLRHTWIKNNTGLSFKPVKGFRKSIRESNIIKNHNISELVLVEATKFDFITVNVHAREHYL